LRIAAVLGDRFSLVDLATVSGGRAVDLVEQLTPAVRARLLIEDGNALVFRHELVHDAIYQDIPAAGRLAMHREAARVLAGAGAPPAEVAAHVLRGSGPGDLWAVGRPAAAPRRGP
jgi:predicted ATPase